MELSSRAGGLLVPRAVRPLARRQLVRYRHFGLRPVDALLVSYPKSGSTWLRFLLAHALSGAEADFDSIRETVPPVGRHRQSPALLPGGGRLVRTHEPLHPFFGRPGQPVLYLARDGRAVALSYLHHERREGRPPADLTTFIDSFLAGGLDGYGPWHQHVLGAVGFGRSTPGPFLLMRYEDLRAEPVAQLARALTFLGREPDRELLGRVVAANTKDRMRAKEATSTFLAGHRTDTAPVVRPDRGQGWAELVPATVRTRFETACWEALVAAGYALDEQPPSAPVDPS